MVSQRPKSLEQIFDAVLLFLTILSSRKQEICLVFIF